MSKSVIQMFNELFARVDALEKRVAAPQAPESLPAAVSRNDGLLDTPPAVAAPTRKMCPKCGVKPAYFFHVRTCTGQKEEQKDADENTVRRRDQGTP